MIARFTGAILPGRSCARAPSRDPGFFLSLNANAVAVKSSRRAVPTRSNISTRWSSNNPRQCSRSGSKRHSGLNASEPTNVNLLRKARIEDWERTPNDWINPHIGDCPVSEVNNGVLRRLVVVMSKAGLSAKSIENYIQVPKMVVASVLDEDGNQVYPRKWNHDFIDMPIFEDRSRTARLSRQRL